MTCSRGRWWTNGATVVGSAGPGRALIAGPGQARQPSRDVRVPLVSGMLVAQGGSGGAVAGAAHDGEVDSWSVEAYLWMPGGIGWDEYPFD